MADRDFGPPPFNKPKTSEAVVERVF